MLVAVAVFGALPLASIRDVTLLRGPSFLGVASLMYMTLYAVVRCVTEGPTAAEDLVVIERINLGWQMLPAFAMLTSAFSCHISTLPIYSGLGPNRGVMQVVVPTALIVAMVAYMGVGLGGYFIFRENTRQNILDSFWERPPEGWQRVLLYAMNGCVTCSLLSSLPLVIWPLRSCLFMVRHRLRAWLRWTRLSPDEVPPPGGPLWFGVTTAIITVVTCIAFLVPEVAVALSIVGSVGGAGIVFIFPSMFFLASQAPERQVVPNRPRPSAWWSAGARGLVAFGAVTGLLSLGVTLHRIASERS